jgi:hypothetical protein
LPSDRYPDAVRADELLDQLFQADGLDFLAQSYPVQLATATTILGRIDEDGLQPDIDRLAGPEFLAHVRETHMQYECMVNDMLQYSDETDMRKHVRLLKRAIVSYAIAMCTTVDDELPETAAVARKALRSIVVLRADNARRSTARRSTNTNATPDTDATPDDGTTPDTGTETPDTDTETPTA